jgi:hypothetical protein
MPIKCNYQEHSKEEIWKSSTCLNYWNSEVRACIGFLDSPPRMCSTATFDWCWVHCLYWVLLPCAIPAHFERSMARPTATVTRCLFPRDITFLLFNFTGRFRSRRLRKVDARPYCRGDGFPARVICHAFWYMMAVGRSGLWSYRQQWSIFHVSICAWLAVDSWCLRETVFVVHVFWFS